MDKFLYGFTILQHNFYTWHAINISYLSCRHLSLFSQFLIDRIIFFHALS